MDFTNWTPEQIITLAGIIAGFFSTGLLTIFGWFFVASKNKAETNKAKAEAGLIYQQMANESAKRDAENDKRIHELEQKIEALQKENKFVNDENSNLRLALAELKVQYDEQAVELQNLRDEIAVLRNKRK